MIKSKYKNFQMSESALILNKHILICINEQLSVPTRKDAEYIKLHFCGLHFSDMNSFNDCKLQSGAIVYMCGNIEKNYSEMKNSSNHDPEILVVKDLSYNYENRSSLISLGEVPINIYNTGVYFRQLFTSNKDYFGSITGEHKFQSLTESNKSGEAFRTGIYLTKVKELENELQFRLLRCSSNLKGPTDNFRTTDDEIVSRVNHIANLFFDENAELNHVLAQVYENRELSPDSSSSSSKVEKKAKIKEHSDKTKDMPRNGLIAFCTFYKNYQDGFGNILKDVKLSNDDRFDYHYKNTSVLTRLRFRLKDPNLKLQKRFDVVLYPNSVFIISLSTNRLYTHEIVPSILPIDTIPIRLGYVIRCSKTEAIFRNEKTFIKNEDKHTELLEPDEDGIKNLKELYRQENLTDQLITYGKFDFSLNKGDYQRPIV